MRRPLSLTERQTDLKICLACWQKSRNVLRPLHVREEKVCPACSGTVFVGAEVMRGVKEEEYQRLLIQERLLIKERRKDMNGDKLETLGENDPGAQKSLIVAEMQLGAAGIDELPTVEMRQAACVFLAGLAIEHGIDARQGDAGVFPRKDKKKIIVGFTPWIGYRPWARQKEKYEREHGTYLDIRYVTLTPEQIEAERINICRGPCKGIPGWVFRDGKMKGKPCWICDGAGIIPVERVLAVRGQLYDHARVRAWNELNTGLPFEPIEYTAVFTIGSDTPWLSGAPLDKAKKRAFCGLVKRVTSFAYRGQALGVPLLAKGEEAGWTVVDDDEEGPLVFAGQEPPPEGEEVFPVQGAGKIPEENRGMGQLRHAFLKTLEGIEPAYSKHIDGLLKALWPDGQVRLDNLDLPAMGLVEQYCRRAALLKKQEDIEKVPEFADPFYVPKPSGVEMAKEALKQLLRAKHEGGFEWETMEEAWEKLRKEEDNDDQDDQGSS